MAGLPPGEVALRDVMEWAQEQAKHLRPSSSLVLWYLCINAFRRPDNPEGREVGDVLSAYATVARIQRGTGLSDKTARAALQDLQDQGYIVANMRHGNGKSNVSVFWTESFDDLREDVRRGIRDLPKSMRRARRTAQDPEVQVDGDVIEVDFGSGKNYRNLR